MARWRELSKKVRRQVTEMLEIPGDVLLDMPKLVLVGNVQVLIENHRGVLEYTSNLIRVAVTEGEVAVAGEELHLRHIQPDEIVIAGRIRAVYFA